MTKRETLRLTHQESALRSLGFTQTEAEQLRRISLTLHRWHELECGVEGGGVERDEQTGKCVWYSSYSGKRTPYADRETGALRRLSAIITARNARSSGEYPDGRRQTRFDVQSYVQGDPRGCALYIIRPGDVPEGGDIDSWYSRGLAIY